MNKTISVESTAELRKLFGPRDENARCIEEAFGVTLSSRPEGLRISSRKKTSVRKASDFLRHVLDSIHKGSTCTKGDIVLSLKEFRQSGTVTFNRQPVVRGSEKVKSVGPRTEGQQAYVSTIRKFDITFAIGPAGTGKTYLAMAMAVEALKKGEVNRIILTRPAIEAGESLGYLPGDIVAKISPYLRPLYDALYDLMETERIEKYLEIGVIEVAPLAYMRGRTLNDAFIILDEAQNCTPEQMKMFLTRLGFESKAVITGDITQSDLPGGEPSGLLQAKEILSIIPGIEFVYFSNADVVRHELVQKIIEAYESSNTKNN